jgi:hypothetical protein
MGTKLGNIVAKNHCSDIDKGSHPRWLTLTHGSWHTAGSHKPVVNGALPKITDQYGHPRAKIPSIQYVEVVGLTPPLSPIETGGLDFQCSALFWVFETSYLEGVLWFCFTWINLF